MRCAHRHRLLWIACLCLASRLAIADAGQARAHFDRGRAFFEVDEYRQAIGEFKAAHIEKPDPAFLYNIAECYRRLGDLSEALQFYRRFLATAPADDKTRPIVEQRVADLKTVADEPKAAPADAPTLNVSAPREQPGAALVQMPASHPAAEPPPFYTRPWFLITVGAVIVASAIAIWALSRTPDSPETPLGNQSVF
jgi:tetratricopeptide (TPR) repeat protein